MIAPAPSAAMTAAQMPSSPNNTGIRSTMPPRSANERRKEISAESRPLHSAVKKADAKMLIPQNR